MPDPIPADPETPPPAPAPKPAAPKPAAPEPAPPEPAAPADHTPPVHLELALHPDDAERLLRAADLVRLRAGRARSAALRLLWADTPDGALAAEGLALLEHRAGRETVWRLEWLCPAPLQPWPPGQPAALLGEAGTPGGLAGADRAASLVPVAACEATLRTLPLDPSAAPLSVTLLTGALRAVAGEQRVARLRLSGPPAATERLALALCGSVRLSVPARTLAGEALAVAGRLVPHGPLGAPALAEGLSASHAFAALVSHLTRVLLHWAPLAEAGVAPEPVHQMRVALRRLRSTLQLFRRAVGEAAPDELKQDLKILQQVLGQARDWDVFTAGTGRAAGLAMPEDKPLARLLLAAEKRRQDGYAALRGHLAGAGFRMMILRLACLAAFRPWEAASAQMAGDAAMDKRLAIQSGPLRDFAGHALTRRLEQVLSAGEDLSAMTAADLHALRIQGKRLRYAAEFFAPLYESKETRRFLRRIAVLQERLGTLNDGAVAAGLMGQLGAAATERGYAAGVVRGFVAAGQRGARGKMARSWRKFRRAEPFWC